MAIVDYWPREEEINLCIKTEAEEFAEQVLLAVHEPMRISRVGSNQIGEVLGENDLLEHFLSVDRPVPIIGKSGVGKSHLIRWLHAKLKLHPEFEKWHIVRIPKNASLRQALELILQGLEGDEFEDARRKISLVGDNWKPQEVAGMLVALMELHLLRLKDEAQVYTQQILQFKSRGESWPAELEKRVRRIRLFMGGAGSISELISDPVFKPLLLRAGGCLYRTALRITRGAEDEEISRGEYHLTAHDIDISASGNFGGINVSDLSLPARNFINDSRLYVDKEILESALDLLNEAFSSATTEIFNKLFQFNAGSFQDLFKSVRRLLRGRDKTLIILVEDMAAISAIEDVLIDSLLEEAVRDGEQELCTLRSAIAVTDGYKGYLRRQDTIRTRAVFEWRISDFAEDESLTILRIVDLCARYINAARHGATALIHSYARAEPTWPPVWRSESDDGKLLAAFGYSSSGVPLFPFNRNAIHCLAERFCEKINGTIAYNPRKILHQVLLVVLRGNRGLFEEQSFPPPAFLNVHLMSASLTSALQRFPDPARVQSLAAIWGYQSQTMEDLTQKLDADIANAFGFGEFAKKLKTGVGEAPLNPAVINAPGVGAGDVGKGPVPTASERQLAEIDSKIAAWIQGGQQLDQHSANTIRKELERMYELFGESEWEGIKRLPAIGGGQRPQIEIPNGASNPAISRLSYFQDEDLTPRGRVEIQRVTLAILRRAHYRERFSGWDYPDGDGDYFVYMDFAHRWVPYAVNTLVKAQVKSTCEALVSHIRAAMKLGLLGDSDSQKEKLATLLKDQKEISDSLSKSPLDRIRDDRKSALEKWNLMRDAWLGGFSYNDYVMDGYRALSTISTLDLGNFLDIERYVDDAIASIKVEMECLSLVSNCVRQEDFYSGIDEVIEILERVVEMGNLYPSGSNLSSANELINIFKGIKKPEIWLCVKEARKLHESDILERRLSALNALNQKDLNKLVGALSSWSMVQERLLASAVAKCHESGGEALIEAKNAVEALLAEIASTLKELVVR